VSGYNDGLIEALGDYFEELGRVGGIAIEALKEQIDVEADGVELELISNTPEDSGGLKASLKRSTLTGGGWYGYRLEYEGNAPDGTSYPKIATILNSGTSKINPRRFIIKAVRKLKGLDDRAAKKFKNKIKKI